MRLLIIFCAIDYVLGFAVLLLTGKTSKGSLSSKVMGAGIAKKICYLTLACVGWLIEHEMGIPGIYGMVCTGFTVTEAISILETCKSAGVTSKPLQMALDKLFKESEDTNNENSNNSGT